MQHYRDQISQAENHLATRLRDQLGGAKSADEMFAIFSRYNALFVRPHIRSAIREYQTTLIDRVRSDIGELQKTFLDPQKEKIALRVAWRLDIPDFSGKIIWIRQTENQLLENMQRVQDVLGEGWANHVEGIYILVKPIT
jgi:dynein heavy chain 1